MKKILETLKQKWAEYLLEVLVITIGILGAFSLNNWNETSKSHSKKIALLQSLNVEFKANLEQLDMVSGYHQKVIVAGYNSLKLIKYNKLDLTDGEMDSLIVDLMWNWTFDPRNGALRSGISSGDIHLIKNDSLRNQLFAWEDLVMDLNEDELQSREHQLGSLDLFSTYTRYANTLAIVSEKFTPSAYLSDYAGLFGDPLFEDYLVKRTIDLEITMNELKIVRASNQQIIKLIEQELESMK